MGCALYSPYGTRSIPPPPCGARSIHPMWSALHIYDTLFYLVFGRVRRFLGLQRVPTQFWGPGVPIGDFTQNGDFDLTMVRATRVGGMERASYGGWSAYESSTGHIYDTFFFLVFGRMRLFLGLQRVPHPILGSQGSYWRFNPKWRF